MRKGTKLAILIGFLCILGVLIVWGAMNRSITVDNNGEVHTIGMDAFETDEVTPLTTISWGDVWIAKQNGVWVGETKTYNATLHSLSTKNGTLSYYMTNLPANFTYEVLYYSGGWQDITGYTLLPDEWLGVQFRLTINEGVPLNAFNFDTTIVLTVDG